MSNAQEFYGKGFKMIKKILCRLGLHDYTNWSNSFFYGFFKVQKRFCKKCNIEKIRLV
jgi:hypothetical protein